MDTYFSVHIQQIISEEIITKGQEGRQHFTWQQIPFELEKCKSERLGGNNQTQDLETMWCPKNFTIQLQGNIASKTRKMVVVEIHYCEQNVLDKLQPGIKCKSKSESDQMITKTVIAIIHKEQYFDSAEFDNNPLKNTVQVYPFELQKNASQMTYFKISRNQLQLKDSWFSNQFEEQSQEFYKIRQQMSTISSHYESYNTLTGVQYFMDENVQTIQRSTDTIMDAFSQQINLDIGCFTLSDVLYRESISNT
ncbi:UNKNOWN [Stylonychia lemnae]|uniref:Uncharacterized protein n=1 Tax=Stylonychia lemnae TaxID=5949 RepID=A0A078BAT2_STYLE|nr:UNKNOWN [Stylonychia lemnae]|eukprot:CDW90367.1 UNKNOWN [Stylonychia lemnae]